MSEKEKAPASSVIAEIKLGEKIHKIKKLKAGKFYEAQKVFMELIKAVAPTQTKEGQAEVDVEKALVSMFQEWPKLVVQFVTLCINEEGVTEETILEEAYPDQVTEAFKICLDLNNVFENLKNSAAPIGELGGLGKTK